MYDLNVYGKWSMTEIEAQRSQGVDLLLTWSCSVNVLGQDWVLMLSGSNYSNTSWVIRHCLWILLLQNVRIFKIKKSNQYLLCKNGLNRSRG